MTQRPVSIVTGSGSGIGLAAARLLSEQGHHVVLAARRMHALESAAASLPGPSTVIPCDVGDLTQARSLIGRVQHELGRIDNLVLNAGWAELQSIDSTDDATLERAYRVNALGPAAMIAQTWPVFTDQRSGCIVCISSMATHDPFPGFFAYAGSKAAVNLMAASCAKEGSAIGIRAFAIAPGAVETPLLRSLFDESALPSDACLTPEAVASVILACIRGERDSENGRVIWMPN